MSNEKRKVAILYDVWEETPPPEPEPEAPPPPKGKSKKPRRRKRREKLDREEIFDALTKLGMEPSYLILDGRHQTLSAVGRSDAELVFNLTESYAGDDTKDMNIAAYLDLLGLPYTGCGAPGLLLGQDKSVAKKLFQFHGIKTPFFATSYKGMLEHSDDIKFPLIVKPTSEDGSIGIDGDSVVGTV